MGEYGMHNQQQSGMRRLRCPGPGSDLHVRPERRYHRHHMQHWLLSPELRRVHRHVHSYISDFHVHSGVAGMPFRKRKLYLIRGPLKRL
jgi:hypothetical protein